MAVTVRDLNDLVRGDDWSIKLTLASGGSAIDITGFTFYFTLKSNINDPDPGDLQVTASSSGQDAQDGIVYITVADSITSGLVPQKYKYDVQQIDSGGSVKTLLLGNVKVIQDVTLTIS